MGSSNSSDDPLYVLDNSDEWLDREVYPIKTIGQKFELNCGRTLGFHVYGETDATNIVCVIHYIALYITIALFLIYKYREQPFSSFLEILAVVFLNFNHI